VCCNEERVYAVFDGHKTDKVSSLLQKHLVNVIGGERRAKRKNAEEAVQRAFAELQRMVLEETRCAKKSIGGSTAVCVAAFDNDVIVANCGDSKAVLARNDPSRPVVSLSCEHRPTNESEARRIQQAGGIIDVGRLADSDGDGLLSVSRGFGNFDIPAFTCSPHVSVIDLTDPKNTFIILGSDGLFDEVCEREAVDIVRALLRDDLDPEACSWDLIRRAQRNAKKSGRSDDISAIVVLLGDLAIRGRRDSLERSPSNDATPVKRT